MLLSLLKALPFIFISKCQCAFVLCRLRLSCGLVSVKDIESIHNWRATVSALPWGRLRFRIKQVQTVSAVVRTRPV